MKNVFEAPGATPDPDNDDEQIEADIAFKNKNRRPLSDEERLEIVAAEFQEREAAAQTEPETMSRAEQLREEIADKVREAQELQGAVDFPGSDLDKGIMGPRLRTWKEEVEKEAEWKKKDPLKDTGKREE